MKSKKAKRFPKPKPLWKVFEEEESQRKAAKHQAELNPQYNPWGLNR